MDHLCGQQTFLAPDEDEEKQAVEVGDRRRNTPATPEFLATLTTCCVCGGPLPGGRRYLCAGCGRG
jgi:hypothetical protein